ncbi:GntR family transcriptional regulator [Micromonospora sp. KC721]|uniref:GntR family transcriptional regulator n=1 Tax=Micromonospora sp. KC721 TaxID=2530380 RepID=UPI001A9D55EF|nr:GntR family transcriptional regulator [Micromonospora sp. KC721]
MGEVNPNDPRPPYVQIADDLRRAVQNGEYEPGAKLPSGRELAKQYGVALMTVTGAIGLLRDEGLVESWQGRGVFVTGQQHRPAPDVSVRLAELADIVEKQSADLADLQARVAALEGSRRTKR